MVFLSDKFEDFYIENVKRVFSFFVLRTSREIALDLTQEVFEKILRNQKFSVSYLFKVVASVFADFLNSKQNRNISLSNVFFEDTEFEESSFENELEAKILISATNQILNLYEKTIVELRIFENLSFKEIANLTGRTESSVKMLFYRAISKIKKNL